MEKADCDIYRPEWIGVNKIRNMLAYPLEIRDWLLNDLEKGFEANVKELNIRVDELRDEI
jgi:hypothetical protein